MNSLSRKEAVILFCGDIFFFVFSLWLSLYVRFGELPTYTTFSLHLAPFSFLFVAWILVYFIAGLYEKHTLILKSKLPSVIFNAQVINSIFAIIFFYSVPSFGIAPKTILFIYLFISFVFSVIWRMYGVSFLGAREREPALLIATVSILFHQLMLRIFQDSISKKILSLPYTLTVSRSLLWISRTPTSLRSCLIFTTLFFPKSAL